MGVNLFVIHAMDRQTPIGETDGAVTCFADSGLLRVVLLAAVSLCLPW